MCSCKYLLRVPKRNGGNCRLKSPLDWILEITLYGGGGALLGFGVGLVIAIRRARSITHQEGLALVGGLTVLGFLAGVFAGERGVIWLGRKIRDRENS